MSKEKGTVLQFDVIDCVEHVYIKASGYYNTMHLTNLLFDGFKAKGECLE